MAFINLVCNDDFVAVRLIESMDLATVAGPTLDVRNDHAYDEEVRDIYAYGAGLLSTNAIVGLSDFTNLQTLSLHGNQIGRIEGLEVLHELVTLNLSSNNITWMEGLSQLKNLRVLNLSNNYIREISGLHGLVALRTLILSHNKISLLSGLSALHGSPYTFQHLDLRDNLVRYVCELWILGGCSQLEEVVFECGGYTNPVCRQNAYHSTLISVVPGLHSLDGSSHMGHAPLFNTNIAPTTYQNLEPPLQNICTRPTSLAKGTTRTMPDDGEIGGYKLPQDQVHILKQKYMDESHHLYQAQYLHKSCDHESMATQAELGSDADYNDRQGARSSVHASAENLVVSAFVEDCNLQESSEHEVQVFRSPRNLDSEAQHPETLERFQGNGSLQGIWSKQKDKDNSSYIGTDGACRVARFVGANSTSTLDKESDATKELATQTDSVTGPTLDQTNHEQPKLNTVTVLIDGNCSYTDIGKQHFLASLELYKKDNELLYLIKEKKILEDEFAAFKQQVVHERNDWQADEERKSMAIKTLGMNIKGCKVELQNLRKTVVQAQRELIAAMKHVESSIVSEEAKKLAVMNSEIFALKEAMNSSLNTYQTMGTALKDANQQKEAAKRTLVSLSADLDEQRSKVKIISEMLVSCTHQERISRKECKRLKSELDMVCKLLRKNKDPEPGDPNGEETEEIALQLMEDELHRRLVTTQTMVTHAIQENAKTLSSMKKLRNTMVEEMLELGKAFEAFTEKEQGAKDLIMELSCIVSAQKTRSEWMQHELVRLTISKEEVEHLQGEISRLHTKNKATEQKTLENEALKCKLANMISNAEKERRSTEEATRSQFSSLMQENSKLVTKASSLAHNFQEAEDNIKAKTKICESLEATIQQLKDELLKANNALHMSKINIKVVKEDLVQRLHDEVEQKCELQNELTVQESIISEIQDELKLTKSAKYAAEQACKSLQQKVNDVESMLRHVDKEINSVKTLYEGREKTISLEKDEALAKVTIMQKKLEDVEGAAAMAMQSHFESIKIMETKEQKSITTLIQKDILIEELKRKILEVEAKLHSRDLALETQKAISIAKVEQLGKVLEELREVT